MPSDGGGSAENTARKERRAVRETTYSINDEIVFNDTRYRTGYEDAAVTLQILTSDEACVAQMNIFSVDGVEQFHGWSKKHPKDSPNAIVGTAVALQRVFEAAAAHFAKVSEDLVEINCEINSSAKVLALWDSALTD